MYCKQNLNVLGAIQKWRHRENGQFWTPLPPLSPFVTHPTDPPPPYVTGANSDKLFFTEKRDEKNIGHFNVGPSSW